MEKITTTSWSIVFDSYNRPIIKTPEKNVLLFDIDINKDEAVINNSLVIKKAEFVEYNENVKQSKNSRVQEEIDVLRKWLKS